MIDDRVAANRGKQSLPVLVQLPTPGDFRQGVSAMDLVAELRRMPEQSNEPLFIAAGVMQYRAAAGHLTPKGNVWVALEVYDYLAGQPAIEERLQALDGSRKGFHSEASPQSEHDRSDAP